jgi:hypothetical protein
MKISGNQLSILFAAIAVSVLFAAVIIFSENPSQLAQAQPQPQPQKMSSVNATGMSTSPVIESKGTITGMRVLQVSPLPKVETSFTEVDKVKGNITASEIGTYASVQRADGSLYGEGQGIITATDGQLATWTGQGIGHFTQDGKLMFHGSLFQYFFKW